MKFSNVSMLDQNAGAIVAPALLIPKEGIVSPEGVGNIGSVVTHSSRYNIYSTGEWASSGPWSTFYNYQAYTDNTCIQMVNMLFGDGMSDSGTTENSYIGDSEGEVTRNIQFANGNRIGYARDIFYYDNTTNYSGCSWRVMPIRNTSSADITISLYGKASDYWYSGYEGYCLFAMTPNSKQYSTTTSVSNTALISSQANSQGTSFSGNVVVPANTTILIFLCSSDWYGTTYRFKDTNFFYNLSTTFSNPNIICDMRMLSALSKSRFNMNYAGGYSNICSKIWTKTATDFGDR